MVLSVRYVLNPPRWAEAEDDGPMEWKWASSGNQNIDNVQSSLLFGLCPYYAQTALKSPHGTT